MNINEDTSNRFLVPYSVTGLFIILSINPEPIFVLFSGALLATLYGAGQIFAPREREKETTHTRVIINGAQEYGKIMVEGVLQRADVRHFVIAIKDDVYGFSGHSHFHV